LSQSPHDVEGFVLAGGQSSRMGRDKALVRVADRPLVEWALEVLHGAGLTSRIAGARGKLDEFAPVIADEAVGAGPLSGVCSALRQTAAEWAVFVPVDLPLIPGSLIQFLIGHAETTGRAATIVSLNGFAQTFPAVVRRDALGALWAELEAGRRGCFAAFSRAGASVVPVEMVAQTGQVSDGRGLWPYRWFWNVNTTAELERLELSMKAG